MADIHKDEKNIDNMILDENIFWKQVANQYSKNSYNNKIILCCGNSSLSLIHSFPVHPFFATSKHQKWFMRVEKGCIEKK